MNAFFEPAYEIMYRFYKWAADAQMSQYSKTCVNGYSN